MPAGAEAVRAERAARRAERSAAALPGGRDDRAPVSDTGEGVAVIRASWAGTLLFVAASAVAAAIAEARFFVAVMDAALFVSGCVLFFYGLVVAAGRSRERDIVFGSLLLLDSAPPGVRARLHGALGVEIVVALATAWIAAPLAFGILVPVWALSCSLLWAAKYGRFGPRRAGSSRAGRKGSSALPEP